MIQQKKLIAITVLACLAFSAIAATEKLEKKKSFFLSKPEAWKEITHELEDGSHAHSLVGPSLKELTPEVEDGAIASTMPEALTPEASLITEDFTFGIEADPNEDLNQDLRPMVNIVELGEFNGTDELKAALKDDAAYQKSRKEHLDGLGGELVEFLPASSETWDMGVQAYSHGYRYLLGSTEQLEQSHFVICNKKLFYINTSAAGPTIYAQGPEMNEIVRSFSCE